MAVANATELKSNQYGADIVALTRKAALVMQRNIVGVDLIQDKISKKWYVLEVNSNPEVVSVLMYRQGQKGLARLLESKNK